MDAQIYLSYHGQCAEAMELYRTALGAELMFLMRYREGPESLVPPGGGELIFHATVRLGETLINMNDYMRGERGSFGGFAILVHLDSDGEVDKVAKALAEAGGKVQIQPVKTMWASRYGIVTDRFGVTWKLQHGEATA